MCNIPSSLYISSLIGLCLCSGSKHSLHGITPGSQSPLKVWTPLIVATNYLCHNDDWHLWRLEVLLLICRARNMERATQWLATQKANLIANNSWHPVVCFLRRRSKELSSPELPELYLIVLTHVNLGIMLQGSICLKLTNLFTLQIGSCSEFFSLRNQWCDARVERSREAVSADKDAVGEVVTSVVILRFYTPEHW